jgi:hypothetical protein
MKFNGQNVTEVNHGEPLPIFTILAGPCRATNNDNFDLTPLENVETNENAHFSFQCYDIYGNKIGQGGEKFSIIAKVVYNKNDIDVDTEIVDDGKGSYSVHFIPEYQGTYSFSLSVGKEKYGKVVEWTLTNKVCEGSTPVLCPNTRECKAKHIDCIPEDNRCDEEKPFKCLVNGVPTCVKSQTDCDCPDGYVKCNIMNYCVKIGRTDMCPFFLINNRVCTSKYGSNYKMFSDGICREKTYRGPNQRVCPIGKVLCPDLSCRNSLNECVETEYCPGNQYRCINQKVVSEVDKCPSTFTCERAEDVCPDGTCVSNEIYCPAVKQCTKDFPYLCQNNNCATDYESCSDSVACGHKNSLCMDNICRTKC